MTTSDTLALVTTIYRFLDMDCVACKQANHVKPRFAVVTTTAKETAARRRRCAQSTPSLPISTSALDVTRVPCRCSMAASDLRRREAAFLRSVRLLLRYIDRHSNPQHAIPIVWVAEPHRRSRQHGYHLYVRDKHGRFLVLFERVHSTSIPASLASSSLSIATTRNASLAIAIRRQCGRKNPLAERSPLMYDRNSMAVRNEACEWNPR